jgi:hypothetical protein
MHNKEERVDPESQNAFIGVLENFQNAADLTLI